jgi:hypothetical protein
LNPGGTGDAPSIKAACDSAFAGDTIALSQGTYVEHAVCEYLSDLTFVSIDGTRKASIRGDWQGPILAFFWSTNIRIDGLIFEDSGGGVSFYSSSDLQVENCTFQNIGNGYSSGLDFDLSGRLVIDHCLFISNYDGVGFVDFNSGISIFSSTFLDNSHAGIYLDTSTYVDIQNNLICGSYYGVEGNPVSPYLSCNDVFNNTVNYSIGGEPDPTGMNGNISVDPQFCAMSPALTGNYTLQSDSPCAPGNHPQGYDCGLIGCAPVGCSTVSIKPTTWSRIKSLYE